MSAPRKMARRTAQRNDREGRAVAAAAARDVARTTERVRPEVDQRLAIATGAMTALKERRAAAPPLTADAGEAPGGSPSPLPAPISPRLISLGNCRRCGRRGLVWKSSGTCAGWRGRPGLDPEPRLKRCQELGLRKGTRAS